MRAVNLLPEKHRPRRPTGGHRGSSYVVLGALGTVVVAMLLYVLTANSINSAKTQIAEAKAETERANAQADQLGAYGDFAKVKQQREDAVRTLAQGRIDWERLVRELAHVLPNGVWIQNASAADSPADQQNGGAAPNSGSGDGGSGQAGDGPTLTLEGCASGQAQVADALVRLRELEGAKDVQLQQSASQGDGASGASSASAGATTGDCGETHGHANYSFQATVSFAKPAPTSTKPGSVPASLGGGQ
jgi:Tfp pilus assembly protein PilN